MVRVQPAREMVNANPTKSSGATVSASDLKVPKKASKEFDKATKLIAKQDWQAAIDQLNKALALYPDYAEAYNNLGVVYAHLGDPNKEREALQKAVAADNHFCSSSCKPGPAGDERPKLHCGRSPLEPGDGG